MSPETSRGSSLTAWYDPFVSSLMFLPVTSEMVGITSTGISSTISAPSSAAPLEPPDPSVPLPSHAQPARATQQSHPPPSTGTLPPYIRAHPPVLPKIFQPGSGIAAQTLFTPHVTPHGGHKCYLHVVIISPVLSFQSGRIKTSSEG